MSIDGDVAEYVPDAALLTSTAEAGDPDAALELGLRLLTVPDPRIVVESERLVRRAVEQRPDHAASVAVLAILLARRFREDAATIDLILREEAMVWCDTALSLDPDCPVATAARALLVAGPDEPVEVTEGFSYYAVEISRMTTNSGDESHEVWILTDPAEVRTVASAQLADDIDLGPDGYDRGRVTAVQHGRPQHVVDLSTVVDGNGGLDWASVRLPELAVPVLPPGHPVPNDEVNVLHFGYNLVHDG